MRYTRYKVFLAFNYDKEEKWLNEMSAKGFHMVSPGAFHYVFEEDRNEQYIYRLELLDNLPTNYESTSYIHFLEETGAEYMGSVLRWVYFRRNAKEGEFELYSDVDSKINHYKRILYLFLAITPITVINVTNSFHLYNGLSFTFRLFVFLLTSFLLCLLVIGILKITNLIRRLKKEKYLRE